MAPKGVSCPPIPLLALSCPAGTHPVDFCWRGGLAEVPDMQRQLVLALSVFFVVFSISMTVPENSNSKPAIAQLAEHLTADSCSNQMVPGSIPGGRTCAPPQLHTGLQLSTMLV